MRLMRSWLATACVLTTAGLCGAAAWQGNQGWQSGIDWKEPPKVDPGPAPQQPAPPPSDAIVLFDGTDLSAWTGGDWSIDDEGALVVGRGSLRTKEGFGDVQLHLEWATPAEASGEGQGRGNSGVFLMGQYELQILDSFENETYYDGQAGAIYKQHPPLVNASRPPGEWQTYDIIFRAPQFAEDGSLLEPARVTALHNGVLIQNNFELRGRTHFDRAPAYEPHAAELPLILQDHNNPVRFRNIWVRKLDLREDAARNPTTRPAQ